MSSPKIQEILNQRYSHLCQIKGDLKTQIETTEEILNNLKKRFDDTDNEIKVLNSSAPYLNQIEKACEVKIQLEDAAKTLTEAAKDNTNE